MRLVLLCHGIIFTLLAFVGLSAQAFIPPKGLPRSSCHESAPLAPRIASSSLRMTIDPSSIPLVENTGTVVLLAASSWVSPAKAVIEPLLDLGGVAFLVRIVLSWYPQVDLNKLPANLIAWPTEPFLSVTRLVVPPAFGVDISPIIWFAFLNFLREILVSDQGILTLLQQK